MTKAERTRLVAWRFKVLQQAARRPGMWRARVGISGFLGRPTTSGNGATTSTRTPACAIGPASPHRSPRSTPREVVSKILYLRQTYHFGPQRIADYLKRFHGVSLAMSSVHRILRRQGMHRLPADQKHRPHGVRWKRYEKPQPGHRLQLDVKFLERIPGTQKRLYQFTAIDDAPAFVCSRSTTRAISARPSDSSMKSSGGCRFAFT